MSASRTNEGEWTEVRVTGQPDGGYPPYHFVFYSNHEHWRNLEGILRRLPDWTNTAVAARRVRKVITTTDWEPWELGQPEPSIEATP